MSIHNLFIGTPYIDIGTRCEIKNLKNGDNAYIQYHKRGWTGKAHKVDGAVFDSKGQKRFIIKGSWAKNAKIIDV